jgi:hypothetical protein
MKKIILPLTSILIFIFLINVVFSSSLPPPAIALNHETKECTNFWSGGKFRLAEGWEIYYSDYYPLKIKTPYGECLVKGSRVNSSECCKQLNLPIADYEKIPYEKNEVYIEEKRNVPGYGLPYKCELVVGTFSLSGGIDINKVTNECGLFNFRLNKVDGSFWQWDNKEKCLLDKNWVRYKDVEHLSHVTTPIGECLIQSLGKIENVKECCNQLGYTFVNKSISGKIKITEINEHETLIIVSAFSFLFLILLSILLIVTFIILKIKTKSVIPFIKTYIKKGLFLG